MNKLYLGIDTSNYKTSVAVTDQNGDIIYNRSEFLDVKHGERGLRQSDAFFKHCSRLPEYLEEAFAAVRNYAEADCGSDDSDSSSGMCKASEGLPKIAAIGVSSRPRRVEGSYMPVFLAGQNAAREIGAALGIPVHCFSHQEGHAAAVLDSNDRCLLFHLSGGTTEFLLCEEDAEGYSMEIVGGTRDISFGQLLDRVGVALGYDFPAGKYLDAIVSQYDGTDDQKVLPRVRLNDGEFNLSGIETRILRLIDSTENEEFTPVISEIFDLISGLLYNAALILADKYDVDRVVMAGGVAASNTVRQRILSCKLSSRLRSAIKRKPEILFGEPELCGDNAIGAARLAIKAEDK